MEDGDDLEEEAGELEIPTKVRQLRAMQAGVGVKIMPVAGGWKIQYFGGGGFEEEEGMSFPTLGEAMVDIFDLLPKINSEEERAKARDMEEILWLRLQRDMRSEQE